MATEFALQEVEPAGDESHRSRYLDRLDELSAAAAALGTLLGALVTKADQMRHELAGSRHIFDAVSAVSDEPSRAFRRDLHAAIRRFERAMQNTRGQSLRILVDDGGLTVTEVARAVNLSVQMVKRLLATTDKAAHEPVDLPWSASAEASGGPVLAHEVGRVVTAVTR